MKAFIISTAGFVLAGLVVLSGCSARPAPAGPNGGDLVPIKSATAYAEVLANERTGEVMAYIWDKDLQTPRPIEHAPIYVGSDDHSVELMPLAMQADPFGTSSRFYGDADWLHGGGIRQGWMHGGGTGDHQEFVWENCWRAGRMHSHLWEELGMRRHRGPGHGTDPQDAPTDQ